MNRVCPVCTEEKPLTEEHFYPRNRAEGTFAGYCKPCKREYNRDRQRGYYLKHKYGLKPEDVPTECQLCGSDNEICVDHCHTTGRVRGFLCHDCNIALGKAHDDPNLLRRMADYLEKA